MSGTTWTKFYWSDWLSEPALRLCSYAARGLWMDMLCIAATHDPIGYVAVAGRGLTETDIARMTGGSESEVPALLGELDRNGVFSRDRQGRIYSRRMVSDAKKAAIAVKNGKNGGNPTLGNKRASGPSDNPPVKAQLKVVDNTQKLEARNQKPEDKNQGSEKAETQQNGRAVRGSRLPADWEPGAEGIIYAIREGFDDAAAFRMGDDFRDFWTAKSGADAVKLDWPATWRRWVREEAKRRRSGRSTGPPKRVGWV
jgi:hypothetical protein